MSIFRMDALYYPAALLLAVAGGGTLATVEAHAQSGTSQVALTSLVEVERSETAADGSVTLHYADPSKEVVVPGDKLRITLSYDNRGSAPATGFSAVNPINPHVQLVQVREDWAELSVDGGKSYGALDTLTVTATTADGTATRAAVPGDVTHIRWTMANAIAPGEKGSLVFYGIVR